MKQALRTFTLLLILSLFVAPAFPQAKAEKGLWSGWITDDQCNPAKQDVATKGHADCVIKCLNKGGKLVLYTDQKKTFRIDNQVLAREQIGHPVIVTGRLSGDVIVVDSIAKKTSG